MQLKKEENIEIKDGAFFSTTWDLGEISMSHQKLNYNKLTTTTVSADKELVRMHFGLKGRYSFEHQQLKQSFELSGTHHNIMYSKQMDLKIKNENLLLETFGVNFSLPYFLEISAESRGEMGQFRAAILEGKSQIISPLWPTIQLPMQKLIQQMLNSPYQGNLNKIFLKAKCLELLVLQIAHFEKQSVPKDNCIKTKADKDRIIAAKELILEKLHAPPSLSEIATSVGLNEFKLKKGFKEIFNTSVFAYLAEMRLEMAKQFLLEKEKTAQEIAFELGYSSPQHFNTAFKKKFGLAPKSFSIGTI